MPTLMEKPPGMSTAETRDLRDTARRTGAKGMVAVNRRFNPLLNQAREMVEDNGKIAVIVAEFYHFSLSLYRSMGSSEESLAAVITPGAIHTIDLIRYLGGDVTSVHAYADNYFDRHNDSFTALLRFDGGATGLLNYNLTSPLRIEKVSFHGRQASAFLVGLADSCVVHKGDVTYDLKNVKRLDPSSPEWSDRPYNAVHQRLVAPGPVLHRLRQGEPRARVSRLEPRRRREDDGAHRHDRAAIQRGCGRAPVTRGGP